MRSGAIENWLVILDWTDVGLTEIPTKKLKTMVSQLQRNFKGRLYKLFAINVSIVLRTVWFMVKAMTDKFTQKKMILHGSDFEKDLINHIDKSNLEKKFGGELDNKDSDYYPPQFD